MTKYQLAKLIQYAGNLETRKRMQKVVYLLQSAGCPFGADFFLHRFGPYSQDVARLTDELVAEGVLDESKSENGVGHQFGYQLTARGKALIAACEEKASGKEGQRALSRFENMAKRLATNDLRELEIASTIAFYFQTTGDWDRAGNRPAASRTSIPIRALQGMLKHWLKPLSNSWVHDGVKSLS